MTSVLVDPDDHRLVWAGVEIDGVFRSQDGGETWTHVETGLCHRDIHAMTIAATHPKRVFASTAREMFTSVDTGETWQPLGVKAKWPLPMPEAWPSRPMIRRCCSRGSWPHHHGYTGHVLRSTDVGQTWEVTRRSPCHPMPPSGASPRMPQMPTRILAFSLFGEVYISEDAGDPRKVAREFGEIRAAAWLPN